MFTAMGEVLFWWRNRAETSSTWVVNNANLPVQSTIGALYLGRGFRKARRSLYCPCRWSTSSTSRWTHLFLRSFFKSCRKDSLFGWFSDCWINFLNVSLAIRVLLLDCRMRYACYSVVDVAAAGFTQLPDALWWSEDVLASWSGSSCRPLCEFGLSIIRGNLKGLTYFLL